MPFPTDRGKYGYAESSGIYYSEYDPTRLLHHKYFRSIAGENPQSLYSGIVSINNRYQSTTYDGRLLTLYTDGFPHSISSRNIFWYDYDAYQSAKTTFPSISGLGIQIRSTGVMTFFRKYPILWTYNDLTSSGQHSRFFTKSFAFPFSDISIVSGDRPLSVPVPTMYVSGNSPFRLENREAMIMPFYQMSDVIWQYHNHVDNMYRNPKTNTVHPYSEDHPTRARIATNTFRQRVGTGPYLINGIPIPQMPKEYDLQLNDLNVKPTGFITPLSHLQYASGHIPGSGYMPYLAMAAQCCSDYIRNVNFVTKLVNNNPITPMTFNQVSGLFFSGSGGYSNLGLDRGIFLDVSHILLSNRYLPSNFGLGAFNFWELATEIPDYDALMSCIRTKFYGNGFGFKPLNIVCSGRQNVVTLDAITHQFSGALGTFHFAVETTPIKIAPYLYTAVSWEFDGSQGFIAPTVASLCPMFDLSELPSGSSWRTSNLSNSISISTTGSLGGFPIALFNKSYDPTIPSFQETIKQAPFTNNNPSLFGTDVTVVITNRVFWVPIRTLEPIKTVTTNSLTFTELTIPPNSMVLNPSSIYIKIDGIDLPCTRLPPVSVLEFANSNFTLSNTTITSAPSSLFDFFQLYETSGP